MAVVARSRARGWALAVLLAGLVVVGGASAFPGANGKVVFVRGGSLYLAGGGADTAVGGSGSQQHPSFSADGTLIAFDNGTNIFTVTPGGTGLIDRGAGTQPAWSPDGTQIAYVKGGDLYTKVLASGEEKQRTTTGGISDPAWSPDGTRIAFAAAGDVEVLTLASGTRTNLTNSTPAVDASPAWAPDATRIAFTSTRDGNAELYSMKADGTAQMRLTTTTTTAEASPSWSPDGTKIAFAKPDAGGIWAINPEDGTLTQLTINATVGDDQPDWASAFSVSTPVVDAPSGVVDGAELNALPVSYTGSAPPTSFAYQWLRCSPAGAACVPIDGATAASYTLVSLDVASTIRVTVTGTSSAGNASAMSAPTVAVAAAAPKNTAVPTITGGTTAAAGVALTATQGTWTGTAPISFSYQWLKCDSGGGSCTPIAGAATSGYTPVGEDIGATLRARVSANNGVGAPVAAMSAPTSAVISSAPANPAAPSIFGTPRAGTLLTGSQGTWTGAPTITYRYQWQRCPEGGSCTNVAGAVSLSYSVTSADVGSRLRLQVTAQNSSGSATATSAQTDRVQGTPPANTFPPLISGQAIAGRTLTATPGTWTGSPTSYAYEWRRCRAANCTAIAGATSASYSVASADVGYTLEVVVTARNDIGTDAETSDETDVVTAGTATTSAKPKATQAPKIIGAPVRGRKLVANVGTWSGTKPITYRLQWQRCSKKGKTLACATIGKATKSTYTAAKADVGKRLRATIVARNFAGATTARTPATAVVKAAAAKKQPAKKKA
jgi:hypothetical protein